MRARVSSFRLSSAGWMGRKIASYLQLRASNSESIAARCAGAISRSSYIAVRFAVIDVSSRRKTRSAEKPTTPPTRTAPRRKAIACCLGRSMAIGLTREKEVNGHVTIAHRGSASVRLDAAGRGRDERGVGAARLELLRACHGDGGGEDQR